MKEKEIERLLKLLKKENRFVRVYTHMAEVLNSGTYLRIAFKILSSLITTSLVNRVYGN